MSVIEVFADVACPFTHVGLLRYRALRRARARTEPLLRVRAWPLEWVNGKGLSGSAVAPKVDALRDGVAPELFAGFDERAFPATSLPALASAAAAYRVGAELGERFSFALRSALFEEGRDVSDPVVLAELRSEHAVPEPVDSDRSQVQSDYDEGKRRGVNGSPHFFTPSGDFFCPSLDIEHEGGGLDVSFDADGFEGFVTAVFG